MESVDDALKFLAKQFESADAARVQWLDEKKQFQSQLQELQAQTKIQDDYAKELVLQVKMLEFALQQERGRYVASMVVPKDKAITRIERANTPTSPFNSPRSGSGKEQTVFRKDSSSVFSSSPNVTSKHLDVKGDSEVSRGGASVNGSMEISRNDVSVTRSKEGETLISRSRVNSKADKLTPPPPLTSAAVASSATPAAAPLPAAGTPRGPPPVEVTTKVNGNFRACKMKLKLSGHLDGVRAICFHPSDPLLVSGSEDCTVKIWNLGSKNTEVEPVATLRMHMDSVLAVAAIKPEHSSGLGFRNGLIATGSKDGTIGLLAFPEASDKPMEPLAYDGTQLGTDSSLGWFVLTMDARQIITSFLCIEWNPITTRFGAYTRTRTQICCSLPAPTLVSILDRDFTLHRQRKTKIVCAIGPSCWSVEMLGKLLDAGCMNVARFNFSHGDHSVHSTALANLRTAIDQRENCHCAVLLDTKGPEIRTGLLKNHTPLHLTAGQTLTISTDDTIEGDYTRIGCNYPHLATSVAPGSRILCDDGALQLEVIACRDSKVDVRVLNSHVLEERKNMCLPGAKIRVPGITEKDKYDLEHFALPQGVDIVSGSFVRSADNCRALRACLGDAGKHIRIHAKIESIEALENLDEILEEADGIHVSRGDLGMELQPEQVFLAQKLIIRKANIAGKPVVTSTQVG
ncbi:hypothetical protein DYB32_000920 [Aphanomyces invadans]|uniref:Pyruvate kinase n=1 Tax=Aphanomyces invadans TaxID=157072 RepID=A0A418B8H6_9STRA|nr:hypothetical protein DYB32_000920 [Aphanomyces invadans]